MKILSIDLGKSRTGIAMCDESETLAYPVKVISEKNVEQLLIKVADTIKENKANLVVMGLPKNMNNSEGDTAKYVREFAERLAESIDCEIVFSDERLSTVLAHNYLNETKNRGKKRKKVIDAVAATVILQNFLDQRRKQRN